MKKVLFILILIFLALAYLAGKYGPDPSLWFPQTTPTPTVTPVLTSTPTGTASDTPTSTPTSTRARVVKKAPVKAPAARKAPTPVPTATFTTVPVPPKATPTPQPICTVQVQAAPVTEDESNDVVFESQDLGTLGANDWVVRGTLSKVGSNAVGMSSDAYKFDPKVPDEDNDRDMYEFTSDVPGFDLYLDCFSANPGLPNPVLNDRDYQLELYDAAFNLVAHSRKSDPVEHIRYDGAGGNFYVVIYGFDGPPGRYRLTVRR